MDEPAPRRPVTGIVFGTIGALLLCAIALAPIMTVGFCADAVEGGQSVCGSWTQSVIGVQTEVWVWVAASAAIVVVGVILARRRRA